MSSTTVESKLSSLQLDAQKQTTTATNNATTTRTAPERVIIDTDPGIDDVMALFLALASPAEIQVEALTITMGNHNDVELLAQNAALVLEMAHQSHEHGIPIIKGSNKPLQGVFLGEAGIEVHSKNGLGNIEPPIKNLNQAPHEQYKGVHAAQFLIDRCTAEPGQITICAIGPLTNIATAVLLGGTKFVQSVRRLTIMGGDVGQQGNMTPVAEANIYNDPDAARIVFDAFPDIHMAGLNCTHQILMTSALRQRMQKASPVGACQFLVDRQPLIASRIAASLRQNLIRAHSHCDIEVQCLAHSSRAALRPLIGMRISDSRRCAAVSFDRFFSSALQSATISLSTTPICSAVGMQEVSRRESNRHSSNQESKSTRTGLASQTRC